MHYPARGETGDKICPRLIIYAAYLHNYMILSVTSKEEFPRRQRQVIIKKYIRQGIIWSDRKSPWRIKQSQSYNARSSLLGDRCDRNLKRKTKTKTNTKTKKQRKKQQQQKRLFCRLKNTFSHYRDSVEFLSRISSLFFSVSVFFLWHFFKQWRPHKVLNIFPN